MAATELRVMNRSNHCQPVGLPMFRSSRRAFRWTSRLTPVVVKRRNPATSKLGTGQM